MVTCIVDTGTDLCIADTGNADYVYDRKWAEIFAKNEKIDKNEMALKYVFFFNQFLIIRKLNVEN